MSRKVRAKKGRKKGARNGGPWYWAARGVWCATFDKKRVVLRDRNGQPVTGEAHRGEAERLWHEMLSMAEVPRKGEDNTLADVLDLYLQDVERRCPEKTLTHFTKVFKSFVVRWPGLLVRDLKPAHVLQWWKGQNWGDSTMNMTGRWLRSALNWAAAPGKGGLIPTNPLHGMRLPTCRKRSAEVVITDVEFDHLISLIKTKAVRDVLMVLWETGTRPINLARATAANLTADGIALVFDAHNTSGTVHKTFGKTGRALRVYLTDAAREVCIRLRERRPEGPLFRTARGLPWTGNRLSSIARYYAEKAGLKGRFVPYSARHSRATALLVAGESVETVSAILGNTPAQVASNYSHVAEAGGYLRDKLNKHSPAAAAAAAHGAATRTSAQ
jgi:integrase